jgi:chromatin segregation and condensation protein Rec8/ScpA/Scc1 (kleisin family)
MWQYAHSTNNNFGVPMSKKTDLTIPDDIEQEDDFDFERAELVAGVEALEVLEERLARLDERVKKLRSVRSRLVSRIFIARNGRTLAAVEQLALEHPEFAKLLHDKIQRLVLVGATKLKSEKEGAKAKSASSKALKALSKRTIEIA